MKTPGPFFSYLTLFSHVLLYFGNISVWIIKSEILIGIFGAIRSSSPKIESFTGAQQEQPAMNWYTKMKVRMVTCHKHAQSLCWYSLNYIIKFVFPLNYCHKRVYMWCSNFIMWKKNKECVLYMLQSRVLGVFIL